MSRTADLTPQAQILLTVLRERGDWTNRAELASAIGKPRLHPSAVFQIEKMAAKFDFAHG